MRALFGSRVRALITNMLQMLDVTNVNACVCLLMYVCECLCMYACLCVYIYVFEYGCLYVCLYDGCSSCASVAKLGAHKMSLVEAACKP